jgi:hypothetical protein
VAHLWRTPPPSGSDGPAWSKPDALETQIGLLPHDLVVVVVVQDTEPVIVGLPNGREKQQRVLRGRSVDLGFLIVPGMSASREAAGRHRR